MNSRQLMVTAVAVAAAHAGKTEAVRRAKEYFQADGLFFIRVRV